MRQWTSFCFVFYTYVLVKNIIILYINPSQNSVLLVITMHPEGKWKFSIMDRGVACVILALIFMQLLWSVGHWDSGVWYIYKMMIGK